MKGRDFFRKNEKITNRDKKIYGDVYRISLCKHLEKKKVTQKSLNKMKNMCVISFQKNYRKPHRKKKYCGDRKIKH